MGLWSCMRLGRAPLQPQRFDGALFPFRDSKTALHGFIDQTGNVRIDARFAAAGSFAEDRAVVRLVSGEMAVIDGRGELLFRIEVNVRSSRASRTACSACASPTPSCAYLDCTGKERFRICNGYPEPAGEGRVMFTDQEHHLHGYVDLAGQVIIAARYASVGRFAEGLAAVSLPSPRTEQDGYIDPRGQNGSFNPGSTARARSRASAHA